MLKIENFNFKLARHEPYFFQHLNLTFKDGKMHFVRGANGVGKSLLFRLVRGIYYQDEEISGTFFLDDLKYNFELQEKQEMHDSFFKHVAVVRQKYDLMLADQLSFKQNLQLANLPVYPTLAPLPGHQPLPELIERFRIDQTKPVSFLSGGQRQILAVLMALQRPAKILLLDEPTAALDDRNATMVMSFLSDLIVSTGLVTLIICHDKELVRKYAPDGYFEMTMDEKTGVRDVRVAKE